MKCLLVLSLVIIATIVIEPVVSSCYFGSLNLKVEDNGDIDQYCDGPKGRMEVGDTVRHACTDCSCTKNGLSCCGVGYKAGSFKFKGCEMRRETDTCCYQFFKTDNPNESCTEKSCPST
ncbi:hypothetical protein LOTGIDRAFT_237138 [Lottia gigantea]|uniref:VWFC domain-containing protein n=1 Tax=Lottia gigantea TaxID=225164 RepID=V4B1M7_LOTGI|nr:hypothetical protein LOTGIDRAFT_237138 [Lottia gigantea]ESO82154.1 hypothetical protein LOTGIDRAFT_237138 [Lottia gigantea]